MCIRDRKSNCDADFWNVREDDADYLSQPGELFRQMNKEQQQRLFDNTARAMGDAPDFIKERHVGNCTKADPAYGKGVADALKKQAKLMAEQKKAMAKKKYPVSYTHLDVYKRQLRTCARRFAGLAMSSASSPASRCAVRARAISRRCAMHCSSCRNFARCSHRWMRRACNGSPTRWASMSTCLLYTSRCV